MSDDFNLSFKFELIVWMTDYEILRLLGALPKHDPTNLVGHLDIQTICLACKMSSPAIILRIYNNLSASDRAEFLKVSKNFNDVTIQEIIEARKIVELTGDQLELTGVIGEWWQTYAC